MSGWNFRRGLVIGMVHCLPLPGSPGFQGDMGTIIRQALMDAQTLEEAGVDALMVENMGDGPFNQYLNKAQLAALATVTALIRTERNCPLGVNAAFSDAEAALAIARACSCSFIRVPVFNEARIYGGRILEPTAQHLIQLKSELQAENIAIMADLQVKHSQPLYPHISLLELAEEALTYGATALVLTGGSTGQETPLDSVRSLKERFSCPVLVGSGVSAANIRQQLALADGCIVGSSLKSGRALTTPISRHKVQELMAARDQSEEGVKK